MGHSDRNLIIPTYNTEVLEKSLEEACDGYLQIRHRLEIRKLAISLWYDAELKKQGTTDVAPGTQKAKSLPSVQAIEKWEADLAYIDNDLKTHLEDEE